MSHVDICNCVCFLILVPISSYCYHCPELWGASSSFAYSAPPKDTVGSKSMVGVKSGGSGVLIGYQVDGYTHSWSAEHFIAQSHIYLGFAGKLATLTHIPHKPGCAIIPLWTRQWRTLSIV